MFWLPISLHAFVSSIWNRRKVGAGAHVLLLCYFVIKVVNWDAEGLANCCGIIKCHECASMGALELYNLLILQITKAKIIGKM